MGIILEKKERTQLWVSPRLQDVLAAIQKEMALAIKKKYGLDEITISGTIASEALAARYLEDKFPIEFKIKKTGLNKGILEII